MTEELQSKGFTNITLIDKENFTNTTEERLLASCGLNKGIKENNLRKNAVGKFNFVFGRVREVNYLSNEAIQNEVVMTDGQKFLFDAVVMCCGMEKDNKKVENLDKLVRRREKPVFSGNSMESALFAGRNLKGKDGKVIFTSEGKKSKDFHLNYSVAMTYENTLEKKSSALREDTQIKIVNADSNLYKSDPKLSTQFGKVFNEKDIEVECDRELMKLDEQENIAIFKDSKGNLHEETYDAIFVDQPIKQNELVRKLCQESPLDIHNLKFRDKDSVWLAGHCLVPIFGVITEESMKLQAKCIVKQLENDSLNSHSNYNHHAVPFIIEEPNLVREYLLNDKSKLEFVFRSNWLSVWNMSKTIRTWLRFPWLFFALRHPFSKFGYI